MSEFDTPNYAEYAYAVKSEGKIKLGRILMIIGYIVFVGAFFGVCLATKLVPLFATCPIFLWMLIFFTWRYVSYDCYFVFQGGMLELGTARNGKGGMRKYPKLKRHVKEASFVGPYSGNEDLTEGTKLYDFSESQSSDKRVVILFEKDGNKCSAIFEGTAKIAKLLASFCPNAKNIKEQVFHG
jgi:hypothetical protein